MDLPYSGAATRSAHYAVRPPVPGVNADHITPDPEPDPFNPVPDTPSAQTGDVWTVEVSSAGPSNQPNLAQVPVSHWYAGEHAVPSGEPYGRAQQAMQERMMVDHADTNYVPDGIRLYQHASEGMAYEWQLGRLPREAGITVPENAEWLMAGHNGYDQTNVPNEVYQGDPANVGRYRVGVKTNMFGLYESPIGKFGQDAQLHAFTGLIPALPYEKAPMENTAPYTPNSTGTAHWFPTPSYQTPSMFSLPSETAITDYSAAESFTSDFVDRSGRF